MGKFVSFSLSDLTTIIRYFTPYTIKVVDMLSFTAVIGNLSSHWLYVHEAIVWGFCVDTVICYPLSFWLSLKIRLWSLFPVSASKAMSSHA